MNGSRIAGWTVAVIYVATVTALGASAFWTSSEGVTWREQTALVLLLPAVVVGIFAIYGIVPLAWQVTGADNGGPHWPITLVYTVLFAAMALANVALVHRLYRWRRPGTRPPVFR